MKNWKGKFSSEILGRGLDYHDANRVAIRNISPIRVEAQVDGSREYNVLITLKNSNITSMNSVFRSCKNLKLLTLLLH